MVYYFNLHLIHTLRFDLLKQTYMTLCFTCRRVIELSFFSKSSLGLHYSGWTFFFRQIERQTEEGERERHHNTKASPSASAAACLEHGLCVGQSRRCSGELSCRPIIVPFNQCLEVWFFWWMLVNVAYCLHFVDNLLWRRCRWSTKIRISLESDCHLKSIVIRNKDPVKMLSRIVFI